MFSRSFSQPGQETAFKHQDHRNPDIYINPPVCSLDFKNQPLCRFDLKITACPDSSIKLGYLLFHMLALSLVKLQNESEDKLLILLVQLNVSSMHD